MRIRAAAVVLALTGLLIAVAVGLAANSIASRSFTPGADALPSAGSLAPPAGATASGKATNAPAKTTTTAKPKPKPKPKPAPVAKPATSPATVDDHGGKGSSGKGSSGKGGGSDDSGGHGGKGGDD